MTPHCSVVLYPLDLLKRRLMVQGHGGAQQKYRNGAHAAVTIVREEGVRGLYRGILPSYMKVIPTVSLTWLSYEVMKVCWFAVVCHLLRVYSICVVCFFLTKKKKKFFGIQVKKGKE